MTYLDRILNNLTDELIGTDEIMVKLGVSKHKLIYVICALKKGIYDKKIRMIINPNIKLKYKGHLYSVYPHIVNEKINSSNILIPDLCKIICQYI